MNMILAIIIPVIVGLIVSFLIFQGFKKLLQNQRQEFKLMGFAASFIIGIFAGIFTVAFL